MPKTTKTKIETLLVRPFELEVHYKKMKNVYLRIKPDGKIQISVPIGTKRKYIEQFVEARREWIEEKLEKVARRTATAVNLAEDETLIFGSPVKGTFSERQLQTFLHEKITLYMDKYFPHFAKHGYQLPQVKYRNMRSTWGVCRPTVGTITFSRRLVHQPVAFIEYVVLHELCHLIVPNHSRDFYNLVGSMMPNHRVVAKSSIPF
jgi:predicted metal-dependent hydrolase